MQRRLLRDGLSGVAGERARIIRVRRFGGQFQQQAGKLPQVKQVLLQIEPEFLAGQSAIREGFQEGMLKRFLPDRFGAAAALGGETAILCRKSGRRQEQKQKNPFHSASLLALSNTARSISPVSLPVCVFWRLGW